MLWGRSGASPSLRIIPNVARLRANFLTGLVVIAPIGLTIGVIAGYFGGKTDTILMRITDVFLAFPGLVLALAFVATLGPSLDNAIIAIALTGWPGLARLARAGLPVIGVSSLAALALTACRETSACRVLAALDARMGEVYWGSFRCGAGAIMRVVGDELVSKPSAVPVPEGGGWSAVGSGWQTYANELSARCAVPSAVYADDRVHADAVAQLALVLFAEGHAVSAEQALPVYLRDQVAWAKS